MKTKTQASRRSFIWKAGAMLSAPLAVAAADGSDRRVAETESLKLRVARLEDVDAIRALNRSYVAAVSAAEDAAALFADGAQTAIDTGVRRILPDRFETDDVIEIVADGASARARVHCVVEIETPIGPACTLVDMARAQGEGSVTRSERRVLESDYVKIGGIWKMKRTAFVG